MPLLIARLCLSLIVFLFFFKTAHAQITITSVTPTSACVGTPITVTYTSLQAGTLTAYLYSTSSANYGSPQRIQSITAGNSLTIAIPTAFTQTSGSYTIRLINSVPPSTTYTSTSTVTINAIPSAPILINSGQYCEGAMAPPLIAVPGSGGILNWYGTSLIGGIASPIAPTPSTSLAGITNYYVSQTINGCEGPRAVISVIVRPRPSSPVVNPVSYCQGAVANILSTVASSGASLNWYGTAPSGGTASPIAPTPSTSVVGTMNYYVSQTINGCEGPRAAINVTVNSRPTVSIDAGDAILTPTQTSLSLTATASVPTLIWSTGETTPGITINTAGVYSVTVKDVNGCFETAKVSVYQSLLDVVYSVKAGAWDDPTVWSINQVPTVVYAVRLRHLISLPAAYEAQVGLLSYDVGGQLQTGLGSGIRVGP